MADKLSDILKDQERYPMCPRSLVHFRMKRAMYNGQELWGILCISAVTNLYSKKICKENGNGNELKNMIKHFSSNFML